MPLCQVGFLCLTADIRLAPHKKLSMTSRNLTAHIGHTTLLFCLSYPEFELQFDEKIYAK